MPKYNNKITKTVNKVEIDYTKEIGDMDSGKQKLLRKIGNTLLKEIREWSKKQISPVNGKKHQKLDSKYATQKQKKVGNKKANLILEDNMLNSIKMRSKPSENKVILEITDSTEKKKSFNHNQAKSKAAPLPMRRFLPTAKKDKFIKPITQDITSIIRKAKDGSKDQD